MTTLKELNGKIWYRFLKVIYILFYLLFFLLLFIVINLGGQDYHDPILPNTVQEVLKDPEFYKLDNYDMGQVLSSIDRDFDRLISSEKYKGVEDLKNRPVPTTPLPKKYIYKSFYTWNIMNCFIYGLIFTICYLLIMECIKRGFYYIVIGKVFPRE
jgi:hypothetical protein